MYKKWGMVTGWKRMSNERWTNLERDGYGMITIWSRWDNKIERSTVSNPREFDFDRGKKLHFFFVLFIYFGSDLIFYKYLIKKIPKVSLTLGLL